MKPHRMSWTAIPAMLVLLSALAGVAYADGEVTFGTQWWDQSTREAKYQEFGDYPNGPYLESFMLRDALWGGQYALVGTNALRADQSTALTYRKPRWTASLEYAQTPHNFSYFSISPYRQSAAGVLVLPDTLQKTIQDGPASAYAAVMSDALKAAGRTPLGFRTDLTRARLRGRLAPGLEFDLRGVRRKRSGNKAYGGSFGFSSAIEIMEPINQTMSEGEARLSYYKNRLSLEAVGGVSAFENQVDALIWDNPRRLDDSPTAGSSRGRIDLYPENRTVRGSLSAAIQFQRRTSLNASVGISQTVQDDEWLPFTINSAMLQPDTFPLPGTNTDGKAVVSTQDVRLTSQPTKMIGGVLRFRRYDYDNQTEEHTIPGSVAYDQSWSATPRTSHPFGHTVMTYGADVTFHPVSKITVTGLAEHTERERTHREVTDDAEDVLGVKVRVRPASSFEATASYRTASRELEAFHEEDYQNAVGAFIEQPNLRRFDVADRDQEQATAGIGWSPNERVSLSLSGEFLRNEYKDDDAMDDFPNTTHLGLLDEVRRAVSTDGSFHVNDKIDLSAGYGWGMIYSNQRSRESSSSTLQGADSTNWQARLKDWFTYATGTVEWRPVVDKVTVSTTFLFERSPGTFRLTNFKGTAIDLPTTRYLREGLGTEVWYHVDESLSLGGYWAWEQFEVDDFANADVPLLFPTTGSVTALFLGDETRDYRANRVGLAVRRTW